MAKAPPTKIMIIRHAEKPPKHGGEPLDVQQDGEPGNGKSLIVTGWQRAGALNAFFAPYQAKPANPAIVTPDYIYAACPTSESQRPSETVTPLATWLKYVEDTPQFNTTYTIGGEESEMVTSVLGLSGTVLICWEHDNIMPHIMDPIDDKVPISNYSKIPSAFPDVFYLVWILDLDAAGTGYKWSSVNQNLMAGDV